MVAMAIVMMLVVMMMTVIVMILIGMAMIKEMVVTRNYIENHKSTIIYRNVSQDYTRAYIYIYIYIYASLTLIGMMSERMDRKQAPASQLLLGW